MSQKNKNILLVVGFALMLILSYRLAISKTLSLKNQINSLKEKSLSNTELNRLSLNLSQRERFADSILQKNNIKNASIQNNLLEFLNSESSKRKFSITSFSEPHRVTNDDFAITSYPFTLKGDFEELQEVIYELEQQYSFGQVVHANFEKKRDYRSRSNYLECFVVVESFNEE